MGLFDIMRKFLPNYREDDELSRETGGILNSGDMIVDENTGTLNIKPSIPKIHISPTVSEKYKNSQEFMKGNRSEITSPAPVRYSPDGILSGFKSPLSEDLSAEEGQVPAEVPPLINGSESEVIQPENRLNLMMQMSQLGNGRENQENNPHSMNTEAEKPLESSLLPDAPIDSRMPNRGDYKTSKFKDILAGILNNISKTDLSKINPEDRTASLLGAIAGGTIAGAGTKDYLGGLRYEKDKALTIAENDRRRKLYEDKLKTTGQRVDIQNKSMVPTFKAQDLAIKEQQTAIRELLANGKLSKDEGDFRIKIMTLAQKDQQFRDKLKQFKTYKTKLNANGTYGLIGVRGDGTSEDIKDSKGNSIDMPDPNAWAKALADIQATQAEELSRVPVDAPQDRRAYINSQVDADLQKNYPDLDRTSRKGQKILKELEDKYASDYDKTKPERDEQKKNAAKAKGTRKALVRRSAPSGRKLPVSLQGIDFSTQWNSSKKGNR